MANVSLPFLLFLGIKVCNPLKVASNWKEDKTLMSV